MRKTLGAAGDLLNHGGQSASLVVRNADELSSGARNSDQLTTFAAHRADDVGSNASSAVARADDAPGKSFTPGGGAAEPYLISQRRAARYEARLTAIHQNTATKWNSRTKATRFNTKGTFKGGRRERLAEFSGRIEMIGEGQLKLGHGKYTSIHGIDGVYYDYLEHTVTTQKLPSAVLESKYRKSFTIGGEVESLLGRGIILSRQPLTYARQMTSDWIEQVINRLRRNDDLRRQAMGDLLEGQPLRRYINVLNQSGQSVLKEMR